MSNYYDYTIKTLIIGDSGVGKSSIMNQFIEQKFLDSYYCTVGVDYKTTWVDISKKSVKFLIWDTAGQERFKSITKIYYRGAQIIIYVFDITNRESFENISNWINQTDTTAPDTCLKVLVGNKCDCDYNDDCEFDRNSDHIQKQISQTILKNKTRKVSSKEAESFAKLNNFIGYYETSAKKNIGIEKLFLDIANYYIQINPTNPIDPTNPTNNFNFKKSSKKNNSIFKNYNSICAC
jgi:Ras-related protein Rab-1A